MTSDQVNDFLGLSEDEKKYAYGIYRTIDSSSKPTSAFMRCGNMNLHATLPIQNSIHGCIWDHENGRIKYFLNNTNFYKKNNNEDSKLDGTDGSIRNFVPEHYIRSKQIPGGYDVVMMSMQPIEGYMKIPACVVDITGVTIDQETDKAMCIYNTSKRYRGGFNSIIYDDYLTSGDRYRSSLGKSRSFNTLSVSLSDFRKYAKNNNTEVLIYDVYKSLLWMCCIEFCTIDPMIPFDKTPTADGYKRGGVGSGLVNTMRNSDWGSYNGWIPITPINYMFEYGNRNAVKDLVISEIVPQTTTAFCWRGFLNLFTDYGKIVDGILVEATSSDYLNVYVSRNSNNEIDMSIQGDSKTGMKGPYKILNQKGYIQQFNLGDCADIFPSIITTDSYSNISEYKYDYFNNNISDTSSTGYYIPKFGAYNTKDIYVFHGVFDFALQNNGSGLCHTFDFVNSKFYKDI